MNIIELEWKNFSVKVDKVRSHLLSILSSNYDGLICNESNLIVVFKEEVSQQDSDLVFSYWNSLSQSSFNPTLNEIISQRLADATTFGQKMIVQAAIENIELGITQAGKTREVSDYCRGLQRYLQTGSLYAAIEEIDRLISLGIPSELNPFITEARLLNYKQQLETYLQ